MSKINGIIPPQNYELIAAKIVGILRDELSKQFTLTGNPLFETTVLLERTTPANQDEYPLVTVRYQGGETVNMDAGGGHIMNHTYFIDFYESAKNNDTESSDELVSLKIQKLLGVIRSILTAPVYIKLDLPTGIVRSKKITQINMTEPQNNQGAMSVSQGQILIQVETAEDSEQIDPELLGDHFTTVKIGDTEDGYTWEFIN